MIFKTARKPSVLLFFATFLATGCATRVNLLENPVGLNDYQHETLQLMAAAAKERCITYEYEYSNPERKISGNKRIYGDVIVNSLHEGRDGWYKAEVVMNRSWGNIYYQRNTRKLYCGDEHWSKNKDHESIVFYNTNDKSIDKPLTSKSNSPKSELRSFAINWEGSLDLIAGKIELLQKENGGEFVFYIKETADKCTGFYSLERNLKGKWSVSCLSGKTARGDFMAKGADKGSSGHGKDSDGRKVSFTIGPLAD